MIERKRKRERERERERKREKERERERERESARARERERETVLWGSVDLRAGRHESSKSTSSRSSHSFAGTLNLNVLYMTECHIIIHICHIIIPCIQQALWTWMSYIWQSVTSSYTYVTSSYLACNRHSELDILYMYVCVYRSTHTHTCTHTHIHIHTPIHFIVVFALFCRHSELECPIYGCIYGIYSVYVYGLQTSTYLPLQYPSSIVAMVDIRHIQRIYMAYTAYTYKHIPAAAVPVFHSCNG